MMLRSLNGLIVVLPMLVAAVASAEEKGKPAASTPLEVFEQRIMPIFKSPQPASCVQCHLAAVDLKDYIRPSHEQTFLSLRDQGLIDLANPEKSKILALIQMGEKDLDKGARLIHEKTRQAEFEAFAAWIDACCKDSKLRKMASPPAAELARPARPDEVIRHARKNRVVDSFVRNVWSQRMRCFPCHTPHELDESNPKLRPAIEKHKEFLEKYGEDFAARMDIFKETPEATIEYLLEKSKNTPEGELPLINLSDPAKSLIILKPTSKLPPKNENGEFAKPSYRDPVSHVGGLKMHVDDHSYKAFMAWIQDYAKVVGDKYTAAADLPADNWFASKHVLMLREVPSQWTVGTRVQLFVYAWNGDKQSFDPQPAAFTQGTVTRVRNVVGSLFLFGAPEGEAASTLNAEDAKLAPGKYLLKVYVDSKNRLAEDATAMLKEDDLYGSAEINARWGEGFPGAVKVLAKLLK